MSEALICGCGNPAERATAPVYGWLCAGCRACGLYVSADTELELQERWARAVRFASVGCIDTWDD